MKKILTVLSLAMVWLAALFAPAQPGILANREYRRAHPTDFVQHCPNGLQVAYLRAAIGFENLLANIPYFRESRALYRLELFREANKWGIVPTFYTAQRLQRQFEGSPTSTQTPPNFELAEIQRAVGDAMAPALREIADIRSQLDTLEREGKAANDVRVRDLEAKLVDKEEELRLAKTSVVAPTQERANEDAFKGAFIRDLDEAKKAFRGLFDPSQVRAIDSGLFATGGKLSPEQAAAFIDFVIEKQPTLSVINTRRMMSPEGNTDELTVSARKMRKATEGTAPTVANGIGTKRRQLSTVEVIWAEDITLTFLEDNIEKRNAETHIARLLATQFGNDANDLGWNGDTASVDPFLLINEGWLKLFGADADVNDVDATGAAKVAAILKAAHKALPVEYKGRLDLAYFVPIGTAEEYANEVSARETAFGDNVLVNGFPSLRYFGRPLIPDSHLNGAKAVLTPTGNLFFGIQRQMTSDSQWNARKRVVEWTLTMRTDYEYATGKAVALIDNIPAGLR